MNTYGIVSFRLPQEISLWEVEQVEALGVEIRTHTRIGEDVSPDELLDQYDSILLAVGMGNVPQLNIPGEELEGVLDAIALVEETKTKPLSDEMHGKKS